VSSTAINGVLTRLSQVRVQSSAVVPRQVTSDRAVVHVASTYDGKIFRSYVNGDLQGEAELAFKAQGPGGTSVGTRMNHVKLLQRCRETGALYASRATAGSVLENAGTK